MTADGSDQWAVRPIGVVRSTLRSPEDGPNQAFEGAPEALLEIRRMASARCALGRLRADRSPRPPCQRGAERLCEFRFLIAKLVKKAKRSPRIADLKEHSSVAIVNEEKPAHRLGFSLAALC